MLDRIKREIAPMPHSLFTKSWLKYHKRLTIFDGTYGRMHTLSMIPVDLDGLKLSLIQHEIFSARIDVLENGNWPFRIGISQFLRNISYVEKLTQNLTSLIGHTNFTNFGTIADIHRKMKLNGPTKDR